MSNNKTKFTPRVRKLPFQMEKCLERYASIGDLILELSNLPGGVTGALDRLGLSVFVEFGESGLTFLDKYCSEEILKSQDGTNFIKQEWMHSSYHHVLNSFLEPRYKHILQGQLKVNYLLYPYCAKREDRYFQLTNKSDPKLRSEAMRESLFFNSAFELSFGIFDAFSYSETFQENVNSFLEVCPFLTYLWLYHGVEEMEHVDIPLSRYEEKFQESIFTKENIVKMKTAVQANLEIPSSIGIQLGLNNNFDFNFKELIASPLHVKFNKHKEILKVGFDMNSIKDKRKEYIELWDNKYEPIVLKAVEKWDEKFNVLHLGREKKRMGRG